MKQRWLRLDWMQCAVKGMDGQRGSAQGMDVLNNVWRGYGGMERFRQMSGTLTGDRLGSEFENLLGSWRRLKFLEKFNGDEIHE